jgi:hypothetical protein
MQQKVAEFAANLLMAGVGREKVAEMGYYYAFSLQGNELKASELIRDAMPEADKIHHERCMVKPIPPTADQGPTMIAGEDLRRGFVYQGPDGLAYQAKPGVPVEESEA